MIANPLQWHQSRLSAISGPYMAFLRDDEDKFVAGMTGATVQRFGSFLDIEGAKAACERHHQVTYVRGLTTVARVALRQYAVWSLKRPAAEEAAKWLSILDEAERT